MQNLSGKPVALIGAPVPNTIFKKPEVMKEKSRGGRPGLGTEKKTHTIFVGFSESEFELLNCKAEAAGLKVQDFIRTTVAKGYVSNIDTPEQHEIKCQLIGLSNHVNQLLKPAHINGLKTMHQKADGILDELLKKYHR